LLKSNGLRYWQVGGPGLAVETEKLQAKNMTEKRGESHLSAARGVGRRHERETCCLKKDIITSTTLFTHNLSFVNRWHFAQ